MKGDFSIFVRKLKGFGKKWGTDDRDFWYCRKELSRWKNAKWKVYPEMGNLEWNVLEQSSRKKSLEISLS